MNRGGMVYGKMGLAHKRMKGSEITGSKTAGGGLPNGADSLESDRVGIYRSVAGTLLCLSLDRPVGPTRHTIPAEGVWTLLRTVPR
eukprot:2550828-Amphidinium_carterae.1